MKTKTNYWFQENMRHRFVHHVNIAIMLIIRIMVLKLRVKIMKGNLAVISVLNLKHSPITMNSILGTLLHLRLVQIIKMIGLIMKGKNMNK